MAARPELYEIGPCFHETMQARILRLEEDADRDEAIIPFLLSHDHRRRQRRLVDAQRREAQRMKELLSYTRLRKCLDEAVS